jgi:IS5 family transposase
MNENKVSKSGFYSDEEWNALERPPAKVTANELKVLRLVRAGEPYRDKGKGQPGRVARRRTLERLRSRGLVRVTNEGFLRCTVAGLGLLLRQATQPKR